jgi:excisionase family DNA binding protein
MTPGLLDKRSRLLALAKAAEAAGEKSLFVRVSLVLDGLEEPPPVSIDLTVKQAALLFGKAESTVRAWVEAGEFPGAYRLHKKQWRIPTAAITAFQARQATPSEPAGDLSAWRAIAAHPKVPA